MGASGVHGGFWGGFRPPAAHKTRRVAHNLKIAADGVNERAKNTVGWAQRRV